MRLAETTDFEPLVVTTGQHGTMLRQVLDTFDIVPDIDLGLCRHGQSLTEFASRAMAGLDAAFARSGPGVVVVQGDTTTTFVGALCAFYRQVPVVHLEAGLRSDRIDSPFPEEANRRLVAPLARLHLAATERNAAALRREGVDERHIVVTGNTVIDALYEVIARRPPISTPGLAETLRDGPPIVTVTAHRRESWGRGLGDIAAAVAELADRRDVRVVWPLHANPAVQQVVRGVLGGRDDVMLLDALPYTDFVQVLAASAVVLSDSGGVQEECPALGVPVVVLRDVTERQEAVSAGAARLVGSDRERIVRVAEEILDGPRIVGIVSPYGDGEAAQRAVQAMRYCFRGGARPADFVAAPLGERTVVTTSAAPEAQKRCLVQASTI
jgi:UDP-N-acetylglucosamine 2-epimerase (non-hydrolysing)